MQPTSVSLSFTQHFNTISTLPRIHNILHRLPSSTMSTLTNENENDDSFEEELETLQSLYGDEITINKSPITVSCVTNV